jgi:GTP-binding protein
VQLVDGKVGATDLDLQARDYLQSLGIEPWIVATKIDKVPRSRRAKGLESIRRRFELPEEEKVISISAVSGEGVRQVWKGILAFLDDPSKKPPTMGMS